jgi:uncharacterized protein (TIRG00374 family)
LKRKAIAVLIAKLLLSLALFALVLAKVHPAPVVDVLRQADPFLVGLWYALVPVVVAFSAWRWKVLAPSLSYRTAVKYTWIGLFFGHVLPGSIAGDIAKGVSLALKDSTGRSGLAASIVAEKVIGLVALLVLFDLACAVVYTLYADASLEVRDLAAVALVLSLLGAFATAIVTLVSVRSDFLATVSRLRFAGRVAEGIAAAAKFYRNRPSLVVKGFVISVVIHIMNIVAMYISFRALQVDAGLLFASVVYPVLSVMLLIPISVSGIGVRDATLALLFTLFGLSAASGVALSWLTLLAVIPNVAVGGVVQLAEMYRKS